MVDVCDLNTQTMSLELASFKRFFDFRLHPFAFKVNGSKAILLVDQTIARDALRHAMGENHEVIVFTGPSGVGKTIVIENILSGIQDQYQNIFISAIKEQNTALSFVRRLDKTTSYARFIVDDAHALSIENIKDFMDLLTALGNEGIYTQIIFIGRSTFADTLRSSELNKLYPLIGEFIELLPMNEDTMQQYMSMRLNLAGVSTDAAMAPRTVKSLAKASYGIPSRLNFLATGALKNAVHNRHRRVQPEDVMLAITHPDMLPEEAYGWIRKHQKLVAYGIASLSFVVFVYAAITDPGIKSGIRSAAEVSRDGMTNVIDFFSDHTNLESPQIPITSVSDRSLNMKDDPEETKEFSDTRSKLLEQLDRESKKRLINLDLPSRKVEQPSDIGINDEQPAIADPVAGQGVSAVSREKDTLASKPPPPAAEKLHKNAVSATPRIIHDNLKQNSDLPAFCDKLHPTTAAGTAYKRRVCVKGNTNDDIYYGQK